jgi:hypothetical protein
MVMPMAELGETFAMKSGRPRPSFAKCVYLNVMWLLGDTIQEPSAVPIFSLVSLPEPVVAEAFDTNSSLRSTRFESR